MCVLGGGARGVVREQGDVIMCNNSAPLVVLHSGSHDGDILEMNVQ